MDCFRDLKSWTYPGELRCHVNVIVIICALQKYEDRFKLRIDSRGQMITSFIKMKGKVGHFIRLINSINVQSCHVKCLNNLNRLK